MDNQSVCCCSTFASSLWSIKKISQPWPYVRVDFISLYCKVLIIVPMGTRVLLSIDNVIHKLIIYKWKTAKECISSVVKRLFRIGIDRSYWWYHQQAKLQTFPRYPRISVNQSNAAICLQKSQKHRGRFLKEIKWNFICNAERSQFML